MKTPFITRTIVAAILAIGLSTTAAFSQQSGVTAQSQRVAVPTERTIGLAEKPAMMGMEQVAQIQIAAQKDRLLEGINQAAASVKLADVVNYETLVKAGTVHFTVPAGQEKAMTEQHLLNVSVSYDARPVGGILTVRADLVPAFSGVGTACRPLISKQFSQAVDNLDDETIATTIKQLTSSLSQQFASR